jgi:2-amino-4-hydroxy-6-hydroxymethyldihydropteridine diphosphokinase
MGPANQPKYINGAVKIFTKLSPSQLLTELQKIEDAHGRIRGIRWGPRSLDLDILLFGNRILNTRLLTIPHPGIKIRSFVLIPLADIQPDLVLPDGSSLNSLLENCNLKGIVPIPPGVVSEKID